VSDNILEYLMFGAAGFGELGGTSLVSPNSINSTNGDLFKDRHIAKVSKDMIWVRIPRHRTSVGR
jgi:hypothetical protein